MTAQTLNDSSSYVNIAIIICMCWITASKNALTGQFMTGQPFPLEMHWFLVYIQKCVRIILQRFFRVLLQIFQLYIYDVNSVHCIPKVFIDRSGKRRVCRKLIVVLHKLIWNYLSFVIWYIILLELAIRKWVDWREGADLIQCQRVWIQFMDSNPTCRISDPRVMSVL